MCRLLEKKVRTFGMGRLEMESLEMESLEMESLEVRTTAKDEPLELNAQPCCDVGANSMSRSDLNCVYRSPVLKTRA
jgi:hypothetical protein